MPSSASSLPSKTSKLNEEEKLERRRLANALKSRRKRAKKKAFEQDLRRQLRQLNIKQESLLMEHQLLKALLYKAEKIAQDATSANGDRFLLSTNFTRLAGMGRGPVGSQTRYKGVHETVPQPTYPARTFLPALVFDFSGTGLDHPIHLIDGTKMRGERRSLSHNVGS